MTIDQGRTGQLYGKLEASYGVEESLAASNAIRHINKGSWNHLPKNKVNSPEKNASPGVFTRFDRKPTTELSGLNLLLRPSGALNTLPEADPLLEAAFGAKTNVTLDTTVQASPSPTTTGCTVASAGTLAVGDAVLIEVTGQSGPFVRVLTGVAGAALTWAPALPAAPSSGDQLQGCITYKLTTPLSKSLTLAYYNGSKKRELLGLGINSIEIALDPNGEIQLTFGGAARDRLRSTAQAQPGGFTTVGGNPPSGLNGQTLIDNTVYLMKTMNVSFTNSLEARNSEYGVILPSELNRNGIREVSISLDAWSETEATILDKADAGTLMSVLNQTGFTEGNIAALYLPSVDFNPPDEDDPDGSVNWSFSGAAIESTLGGNDEVKLILA